MKVLSYVCCMAAGAAVGATISYILMKRKYYKKSRFIHLHHCLTATKDDLMCGMKKYSLDFTKIFVITDGKTLEEVILLLQEDIEKAPVLGFDCEWTSTKDNRGLVSLLQISTISGYCFLLRLSKMGELPESLSHILANTNIFKVGVGCLEDAVKLLKDRGIVVNGCVDLRNLASYNQFHQQKSPLYDNCKLEAPDGQLLSAIDKKKARWYVERQLATVMCEEPLTVRLRFEPAGRPTSERDYYLHDKENVCAVCGGRDSIVRKNVVPHEYRKHFPLILKDHVSHDILPLCTSCHQKSGLHDSTLRSQLAAEFDAPLGSAHSLQYLEDPQRRGVRSAGRALAKAGHKLPPNRMLELQQILLEFFQVDRISDEIVAEASNLETRYHNEAYIRHGAKVVSELFKNESLQDLMNFERRWREHFVATMRPAHLPYMWSVQHNHARIEDKLIRG